MAGDASPTVERLAQDLYECVIEDKLENAKYLLQRLEKDTMKRVVGHTSCYGNNAPLFIAARQGQVHFVNYLLEECDADIEQKGVYEHYEQGPEQEDPIPEIYQVSPLWCAAMTNQVEVVKTLLKHGADINPASDSNSTPVRAACSQANIEVVKVLVENGADIHEANHKGQTCLISSIQSTELCRYLIEKGASVNHQDKSRNLALHYAIKDGHIDTVKVLLEQSSSESYVKKDICNDFTLTVRLVGDSDMLQCLIEHVKPTVECQIEAFELMGANLADKDDIDKAISTWRKALDMRYQDPENIIRKKGNTKSNPAYMGVKEATTMAELDAAATNPDVVYMQALLTRERILGPYHIDTVNALIHRGGEYTSNPYLPPQYQRCIDLWKYAFQLLSEWDELPDYSQCVTTLQSICYNFWRMREYSADSVRVLDVCEILDMAVVVVDRNQQKSADRLYRKMSHMMLLHILDLIHFLFEVTMETKQRCLLGNSVRKLIDSGVTGKEGKTLLHLAADVKRLTNERVPDERHNPHYPNIDVIELIIDCGCDVNSMDNDRNTALHVCAEGLNPLLPPVEKRDSLENIVVLLLERGAHIDYVNNRGINVAKMLEDHIPSVCAADYIRLKCLAASAIKKYGIKYEGEVPIRLVPFITLH